MTLQSALEILAAHRGEKIVISSMSAVGCWPDISDTPLDFNYIPSAMGHAISLGLGLSLALPDRGVIVLSGDGSLLMNLGCLVTVAQHPANLCIILLNNEMYEITGGQPTVGAGQIDFPGLARSSGIARVYDFPSLEDWKTGAAEATGGNGPIFIHLKIDGRMGEKTPSPPRPMSEQIERLRGELAGVE